VGARGVFCFSFFVPNVFPTCSQNVPKCFPNVFPKMFPIAPQFYPIRDAQSSTHLNINYYPGVRICFCFATWGPKRCFYWGHAQCSQKICRCANQYGSFFLKRKSCERIHDLINMNHTLSPIFCPCH
jgi:hypothetical protein